MLKYLIQSIKLPMKVIKRLWFYGNNAYLWLCHPRLRNSFTIESHLTYVERAALYRLANKAHYILEIGSYIGASAACFGARAIDSPRKRVLCIDTWNNDAMTEGGRDTWHEFAKNTEKYRNYIHPIRGFSTDVVGEVKAITRHIDLLFIDGDHSYEGVKADWDAYKSMLREDSIVVFHDYGWAEGVQRVVQEDVVAQCCEFDSLPNMWWGRLSRQP